MIAYILGFFLGLVVIFWAVVLGLSLINTLLKAAGLPHRHTVPVRPLPPRLAD